MKNKMIATILISGMLLTPFPVFAANSNKAPIKTLNFDEIAELVEERNPEFKVLSSLAETTAINLEIQEDSIRDSISNSISSVRSNIDSQIKIYKGFEAYYDALIAEKGDPSGTFESIKNSYAKTIEGLEQSRHNLDSAVDNDWKEDFKEIEDLTMQNVHLGVAKGLNGYIYSLQKTFLAYQTLTETLENLKRQYDVLENNYDTLLLQQELELVTESDVVALGANLKKMKSSVKTLEESMKDLLGSINLALGQEHNSPLELGEAPVLDQKKIDAMHYYKDYETAKKNNFTIREKRLNYELTDEKLDQASGEEEELLEIEFGNAELEWQEQEKKFAQVFDKTFRAVEEAQTACDDIWLDFSVKMTQWNQTQLKYELGLIAKREWETAKNTYDSDYSEYKTAKQTLYEAYLDYEWLLKGMEFSNGSATASAGSSAQSSDRGF